MQMGLCTLADALGNKHDLTGTVNTVMGSA